MLIVEIKYEYHSNIYVNVKNITFKDDVLVLNMNTGYSNNINYSKIKQINLREK